MLPWSARGGTANEGLIVAVEYALETVLEHAVAPDGTKPNLSWQFHSRARFVGFGDVEGTATSLSSETHSAVFFGCFLVTLLLRHAAPVLQPHMRIVSDQAATPSARSPYT